MSQSRRLFLTAEHFAGEGQRPKLGAQGAAATAPLVDAGPSAQAGPANPILLADDEAHYARDVLRLNDGDEVEVLDGMGHVAQAQLVVPGRRGPVQVLLRSPWAYAPQLVGGVELTVLVALPKGERADWMVEKLAEMGCKEVVAVQCARSLKGGEHKSGHKRFERLARVARAAARQARHGRLPQLNMDGPMPLALALTRVAKEGLHLWVADLQPELLSFGAALASTKARAHAILLGPEGGLTPDELNLAAKGGYTAVGLGRHVLRVETAAVAAAAVASQAAWQEQ